MHLLLFCTEKRFWEVGERWFCNNKRWESLGEAKDRTIGVQSLPNEHLSVGRWKAWYYAWASSAVYAALEGVVSYDLSFEFWVLTLFFSITPLILFETQYQPFQWKNKVESPERQYWSWGWNWNRVTKVKDGIEVEWTNRGLIESAWLTYSVCFSFDFLDFCWLCALCCAWDETLFTFYCFRWVGKLETKAKMLLLLHPFHLLKNPRLNRFASAATRDSSLAEFFFDTSHDLDYFRSLQNFVITRNLDALACGNQSYNEKYLFEISTRVFPIIILRKVRACSVKVYKTIL